MKLSITRVTTTFEESALSYKHYANTSVLYSASFKNCKNDNIKMKIFDIFLIFAQNIDCEAVLTSTHYLCFRTKKEKNEYPCKPQFYYTKGL